MTPHDIPDASFAALFEQSPTAALLIRDGAVLAVNRNALLLFGLADRQRVVGHDFVEFVAARDRAAFDESAVGQSGDDLRARVHEVVGVRGDGVEFPMETVFGRIAMPDRSMVLIYASDLTDRREREAQREKLESQARQSAKMEAVGQLAGGIAHDFNNLMTVVHGYTDLLLTDPTISPEAHQDLVAVADAARRAAVLTRQLLTFSRQQVLKPQTVPIDDIVAPIVPMLRRVLGEQIELVYVSNAAGGAVLADPSQVEQILMNLAINARDAMPSGGRLTVETASVRIDGPHLEAGAEVAAGQYIVLVVTDTGTGMDEATRSRIFEPFFTTKAVGHGTGLGLATVYGIAQQSGGHVWVYSEPGQGSVFKVFLPQVEASSAGATVEPDPIGEDAPGRRARTILLVEDEAPVRGLMKTVLLRRGYQVLNSASPSDALRIAETAPEIDLLLTDVVMPGMSGAELARRLRTSRPGLPVLFASGYTERAVTAADLAQAGVSFLQKPFTAAALARAVGEALERGSGPRRVGDT